MEIQEFSVKQILAKIAILTILDVVNCDFWEFQPFEIAKLPQNQNITVSKNVENCHFSGFTLATFDYTEKSEW